MTTLRQQTGFGLIEVLIAMLIIAVGLLGISAVQLRATQAEMESYQRAQAMLLLDDMVNRMHGNSGNLICYVLDGNVGTGVDYGGTGCDGVASTDLTSWHNMLLGAAETLDATNIGAMLGARGCVTYDVANDMYTVTVAWQGMAPTFAPVNNDCAAGLYSDGDETFRRIVAASFRIGTLL